MVTTWCGHKGNKLAKVATGATRANTLDRGQLRARGPLGPNPLPCKQGATELFHTRSRFISSVGACLSMEGSSRSKLPARSTIEGALDGGGLLVARRIGTRVAPLWKRTWSWSGAARRRRTASLVGNPIPMNASATHQSTRVAVPKIDHPNTSRSCLCTPGLTKTVELPGLPPFSK
jgi:hypothetical protein